MTAAVLTVAMAASVWMLWLAWRALCRLLPGPALEWTGPLRLTVAGAGALFAIGVWWGWPGGLWAPDEMWPDVVLKGLSKHYSNGWFDLYPPLHFYVVSAAMSPVLIANALGMIALAPQTMQDVLWLIMRFVSVGMSVGTVVLMARLAQECAGRGFSALVALCAAASLPLPYYAKTANLDVPYLFWFVASLLLYRAAMQIPRGQGSTRHLVGFAVAATMAVTTKDQAYGLYVLPVLVLAYRMVRLPGGWRALVAAFIVAGVVFATVHNLWLNSAGFAKHLALITGDGSESFRLVPPTPEGEWALLKLTAAQLFWCLGVPGVLLVSLGLWQQWQRGIWPNWLWLFPVSYLLTFIAVIGYVYDRFLLGPALVLALLSASGLHWLLSRGRLGRVGAAVLSLWLVWRVVSVDVLLVNDSRYAAEAWLRDNAAGATIATTWQAGYLPRFRNLQHQEIRPTPEATIKADPAFVVVNVEFVHRYPGDAPQPRWLAWLESAEGPYREVFRYKAPLAFTELAWWSMFVDRRETLFTNLDKANPEIVIFGRR